MAENITGMDKLQLGRQGVSTSAVRLSGSMRSGLLAQKDLGFHRLPQGVNGGVGHLGGVDEHLVPVDREGRRGCPCEESSTPPLSACR